MSNKLIVILSVFTLSVIASQIYAFNSSNEIPKDFWFIPLKDWLSALAVVIFGVFVADKLTNKASSKLFIHNFSIQELTNLRMDAHKIRVETGTYIRKDGDSDSQSILILFEEFSAKINIVESILKKHYPNFDMKQFKALQKYFTNLNDMVLGDNWKSQNFTHGDEVHHNLWTSKIDNLISEILASLISHNETN